MTDLALGRRQRATLLLLVLASGFAGLGYQIVWAQQCALWLGQETPAVLAVIAAFFGGLAVGAFAWGARIANSRRPVRWYAGCELVVAIWSLGLLWAMPSFSAAALWLTGVQPAAVWQWLVAFVGAFVLFLPATAAMGATLPAMERVAAQLWLLRGTAGPTQRNGASIAMLYAFNTAGAVVGVVAAGFWLIPKLGLARTAAISIAVNLLCAVTSSLVFPVRAEISPRLHQQVPRSGWRAGARGTMVRLAFTGFLGIGYEVLVVRVLSQVTENTVYTFAMLLAVYLVGSAAGAAGYQYFLARGRTQDRAHPDQRNPRSSDDEDHILLAALACACLLGTASLWGAEQLKLWVLRGLGGHLGAALAAEALLAITAFGPPTLVMGALFSHLCARARLAGVDFGSALAANTAGGAAAPALWGVVAVPTLGSKMALLLICAGYLALTARRTWSRPLVWIPAGIVAAVAVLGPPLAFVEVPAGGRLVHYREGVMAAVSVVADARGVARLRINNRQQEGSSASFRVDARQAWLPLLLHPAPRRALFLGLGTGVTAGAAAEDPVLEVDAVELLPEVVEASQYFEGGTRRPAAHARLRVMVADARRYVRTSEERYDVIVSDNFHPARSGSGALYTVEHFRAVHDRLDAHGLFCQWLPLHQLDLDSLRIIVRSFLTAFPQSWGMLASNSLETPVLGLVGRADGELFDAATIERRTEHLTSLDSLHGLGLEDGLSVLGSFFAGPRELQRLSEGATVNTDDHPVVAYRAPRVTYAPDSLPRDRLLALLRELSAAPQQPDQLVRPPANSGLPERLRAYWAARDRFIELGRDVRPSARVEEMLAQVREPLLAVLRISPDFRPAYDPLLSMARELAETDGASARSLLTALTALQPARSEAQSALRRLFQ